MYMEFKWGNTSQYSKYWGYILEDISHFCGVTDTPVLDFYQFLPWVSKPENTLLHHSSATCKRFLRFISCLTTADLWMGSMVAEPFLMHILGGFRIQIKCRAQCWLGPFLYFTINEVKNHLPLHDTYILSLVQCDNTTWNFSLSCSY